MSKEIEFAKQKVLAQFSSQKADVDHVLNTRGFHMTEVQRWNPKQQDALNMAIEQLIDEGLIEDRNGTPFLTQKGVDYIYPEIGNFVQDAILSCFAKANARAGHIFNSRGFMHTIFVHWNPKQKAGLKPAIARLVTDGLVEDRGGDLFLTDKGFEAIY